MLSDLILGGNNFSSPVATEELCSAVGDLYLPCVKFKFLPLYLTSLPFVKVPKCTTLTSLDLSNCELGEDAKISLCKMVQSAQSLRSLKLNDNPCLGDKGGEAIVSG